MTSPSIAPKAQDNLIGSVVHTQTRQVRFGRITKKRNTRAGTGDFGKGLVAEDML